MYRTRDQHPVKRNQRPLREWASNAPSVGDHSCPVSEDTIAVGDHGKPQLASIPYHSRILARFSLWRICHQVRVGRFRWVLNDRKNAKKRQEIFLKAGEGKKWSFWDVRPAGGPIWRCIHCVFALSFVFPLFPFLTDENFFSFRLCLDGWVTKKRHQSQMAFFFNLLTLW